MGQTMGQFELQTYAVTFNSQMPLLAVSECALPPPPRCPETQPSRARPLLSQKDELVHLPLPTPRSVLLRVTEETRN